MSEKKIIFTLKEGHVLKLEAIKEVFNTELKDTDTAEAFRFMIDELHSKLQKQGYIDEEGKAVKRKDRFKKKKSLNPTEVALTLETLKKTGLSDGPRHAEDSGKDGDDRTIADVIAEMLARGDTFSKPESLQL